MKSHKTVLYRASLRALMLVAAVSAAGVEATMGLVSSSISIINGLFRCPRGPREADDRDVMFPVPDLLLVPAA